MRRRVIAVIVLVFAVPIGIAYYFDFFDMKLAVTLWLVELPIAVLLDWLNKRSSQPKTNVPISNPKLHGIIHDFSEVKTNDATLKLLEVELGFLIAERPSTFMTSGDAYVGKIPFRDRVATYALLETKAESLIGVDHNEFYVNPELLTASESNSAHLTELASRLLRRVQERKLNHPQVNNKENLS